MRKARLLLSLLLTLAASAATPSHADILRVAFQAPSGWGTPNLYCWLDNTNPVQLVSGSWSGDAMTYDDGSSLWLWQGAVADSSNAKIIFNYKTSKGTYVQTKDLDFVNNRVWTIQEGTDNWELADNEPEIPDSIDWEALFGTVTDPEPSVSITVYYDNTKTQWAGVNVHYWDGATNSQWPGVAMTLVRANIYKYDIPEGSNALFCNGNTSDMKQTKDINSIAAGHLYYGTDPSASKIAATDFGEFDPDTMDGPFEGEQEDPEEPDYSAYDVVLKNCTWAQPYVYVWDPDNGNYEYLGAWPGAAMTSISGTSDWYFNFSTQPATSSMIIFNSVKNGSKTGDLKYEYSKIWSQDGDIVGDTGKGMPEIPETPTPDPASVLGAVTSYEITDYGISAVCANGVLDVTFYGDGVVKVFPRLTDFGATAERPSITVCGTPGGSVSIADNEEEGTITLSTDMLTATVDKATSLISFADADGTTMLAEVAGMANRSAGSVEGSFFSPGVQAFYGSGYQGATNLIGSTLTMTNLQTGGWNSSAVTNHNICIPFIVADTGFGLLFDDHYRDARITPAASGITYTSGSLTPVAYYYVAGGSAAKVLENYTSLTGRQELPPYWAQGYLSSRFGYLTRQEAESAISQIKAVDIPLDGLVFDIQWQSNDHSPYGMGNLDWNTANFPNPAEMLSGMLAQGVHSICITEPFISAQSANYSTALNNGYLYDSNVSGMSWIGGGGLIDVTKTDAMDWFWKFYEDRTREGVSAWWLDLGEPEQHYNKGNYADGSTFSQMHNEYGQRWLKRIYDGWNEQFPAVRPFFMPRAGTAGMQRYAAYPWTGDIDRSWNGLQVQIPSLLSSGMSGVPYMGSDVGGFNNTRGTNPELYLRWVQFAAFSPMLRTHTDYYNDNSRLAEPYHSVFDDVRHDVRAAINRRYSYLPYNYTLAYEASTTGHAMARPMMWYDREHPELLGCNDQYYWGNDLLVAPMLRSGSSRSIAFPESDALWVDLNTYEIYNGGTTAPAYSAPQAVLPHFARMGSVIPRYMADSYTNTADIDKSRITLDCYTDGYLAAHGCMFDDDRQSRSSISDKAYRMLLFDYGYDNGFHFSLLADDEGEGYAGEPSSRSITLNFPVMITEISELKDHEGNAIRRAESLDELAAATVPMFYQEASSPQGAPALRASAAESGYKALQIVLPQWDGAGYSIYDDNYQPTSIDALHAADGTLALHARQDNGGLTADCNLPEGTRCAIVTVTDMYGRTVGRTALAATKGHAKAVFTLAGGTYVVSLHVDAADGHHAATAKSIR